MKKSQLNVQDQNHKQKPDEEVGYMTKEELIDVFYNNYDAFSSVAEYMLKAEEIISIEVKNNIITVRNTSGIFEELEIDSFELSHQITLICSFGFDGAGKDIDGTRVFFSIRYSDPPPSIGLPGSRGVIYVPGGLRDASQSDILKKKNWYYFFNRFN